MALWEDETKVYVDTMSVPLVDELPNIIGDAVLTGVLDATASIADHIQVANILGISSLAKKYYQRGKSTYIHGLPEGSISHGILNEDDMAAAILADTGHIVSSFDFYTISGPLTNFTVYVHLQTNFGWTVAVNRIQASNGYVYHLESYHFLEAENGVSYIQIILNADDYFGETVPNANMFISARLLEEDYYHVIYYINGNTDDPRYWYYHIGSGVHPDLDYEKTEYGVDYYPIVPIRLDFFDMSDDTAPDYDEEMYKSCKRQLKVLNLDIDDLISSINEDDQVADVDSVFFILGLSIYSKKEDTLKYLFNFFADLYTKSGITKEIWEATVTPYAEPPVNFFEVTELVGDLNTKIQYNYITNTNKIGAIPNNPEELEYTSWWSETNAEAYPVYYQDYWGNTQFDGYIIIEGGTLIYNRQNYNELKEPTDYDEILIFGIVSITLVHAYGQSKRSVKRLHLDEFGDGGINQHAGFLVPLNHKFMEDMHGVKDDYVTYDALQLVFYSAEEVDIPWYRTSSFLFFVKFVISYLSLVATAFGLSELGRAGLALIEVVKRLAVGALTPIVANLILKHVKGTWGIILAAIVSYAGSAYAGGGGVGLQDAFRVTVESLLKSVMVIASTIAKDVQYELSALQEEYSDFLLEAKEMTEELEKVRDMLRDSYMGIHPYAIIDASNSMAPNETPAGFFERTVHTMNPGVLSLDIIETYVDNALVLPTLDSYYPTMDKTEV